ncbi:cAMP-regulated phosphoprotein family protein [Colletotrichum tofieldiae]|nr:cAMP-regulated phosphoprotein family protein [Colletotrichum tofieldiae]
MNPLQKNKIDVSSLSPEEQRLFRLYGKLPSRSDHFAKHLKDRKYFDSGDYAMSKAGKGDSVDTGAVGSQHPVPENIPTSRVPIPSGVHAGSPVKEASFLNRETSAEEVEHKDKENNSPVDGTAKTESIPIRR